MKYVNRWWTRWKLNQQEMRTHRSLTKARYAKLNWRHETKELIQKVEADYPTSPLFRREVASINGIDEWSLQINAYTDRLLPPKHPDITLQNEEPASLMYSLHPNGTIAVTAHPHSSVYASLMDKAFILDVLPATHFAGEAGQLLVERHLGTFSRLCLISMTEIAPSADGGKFLEKLRERTEQYRNIFADSADQRKNRAVQEANLGIGLAAGLMASTLLPLMPEVGKISREKSKQILIQCQAAQDNKACLANQGFAYYNGLGAIDTTVVIVFGGILTSYAVWTVKRILRRR